MDIAVALFRRDPISRDPRKRKIYQRESYHWGLLVVLPNNLCDAYDATDRNDIDPVTFRQRNPTGSWWFNPRQDVNPLLSGKFLGYIIIGTLPSSVGRDEIKQSFAEVPMPAMNSEPQESCVTWVASAIRKLCDESWIPDLAVEEFMDWALLYADQRLRAPKTREKIVHYNRGSEEEQTGTST